MGAYYNEIDPYAAQWLRNLIAESLIAPGDVDCRPIQEVTRNDVRGYQQAHFFAGIGGWSYALRLAGWPDDRPVWTGSCPCQPFSAAGTGKASGDERHLWPEWFRLIRAVRPPTIFGEQVEAAIGWGWLDLVHTDLEAEGYSVGAAVLPACSIGAPHIRQRLWFMADADGGDASAKGLQRGGEQRFKPQDGIFGELADSKCERRKGWAREASTERRSGDQTPIRGELQSEPTGLCADGVADATSQRVRGIASNAHSKGILAKQEFGNSSPWGNLIWLPCTDGKQRPTQSGIFPLAHGIPGRVAKLRAAGNAIVPQVAAEFIKASMG